MSSLDYGSRFMPIGLAVWLACICVVFAFGVYAVRGQRCVEEAFTLGDEIDDVRRAVCWSRATLSIEVVEGKTIARCRCADGGAR